MGISKLQGLWVTCNPHKFEIPALWFPYKPPVNPCKHLQCGLVLVLGLKEGLVECATVCVKSWVILCEVWHAHELNHLPISINSNDTNHESSVSKLTLALLDHFRIFLEKFYPILFLVIFDLVIRVLQDHYRVLYNYFGLFWNYFVPPAALIKSMNYV